MKKWFPRSSFGLFADRPNDSRADETARHRDAIGSDGEVAGVSAGAFWEVGAVFYGIARDIDERLVRLDRVRKSVGAEDTFFEDIFARRELQPLIEKIWRHCEAHDISGKTVTVKVKYSDFTQATRSKTISTFVTRRRPATRYLKPHAHAMPKRKACRGRRCGRPFEKNRTTAGRRSAAVPTDVPGRRSGPSETRSIAGGGASLR